MKGAVLCFVATIVALQWTDVYGYGAGVRVVVANNRDFGYENNGIVKTAIVRVMDRFSDAYVRKHPSARRYLDYMRFLNRRKVYNTWNNWSNWCRNRIRELNRRPTARDFRSFGERLGNMCRFQMNFMYDVIVKERCKLNAHQRRFLNTPPRDMPIRVPGKFF
uniref:Egg-lysin n=1 Tax=Tegula xanthostigma TaxID=80362 RepID=Q9GV38_9VEST